MTKWINEKGPGLFHICFEVEDLVAALAELKQKGVKLRDETPRIGHGGARIAFLDPSSTGNVLIELAELSGAHGSHEASAPASALRPVLRLPEAADEVG